MGIRGRLINGLATGATYGSLGSVGGPWGAGIGAAAGLIQGLFTKTPGERERSKRKKQLRAAQKAAARSGNPQGNALIPGSNSTATSSSLPPREGDAWNGYDPQLLQTSPYTPAQIASQNQLLPGLTQSLANGVNATYDPYAERARREFDMYTIPQLREQFEKFGGTGGGNAEAAISKARGEFESALASGRADFDLQRRANDQNLYHTLMNPAQQNHIIPGEAGIQGELLANLPDNLENLASKAWEWYNREPEEAAKAAGVPTPRTPQEVKELLKKLQGKVNQQPLTADEKILQATQNNRLGGTGQPNYTGGPNYGFQRNSLPQQTQRGLTPDELVLRQTQNRAQNHIQNVIQSRNAPQLVNAPARPAPAAAPAGIPKRNITNINPLRRG